MIFVKELETLEDFESLNKGDCIACEFHRDMHDYPKKFRFGVFTVFEVKPHDHEIILQKKSNIYLNYKMFVEGNGILKSAILIYPQEAKQYG